MGSTYALVCYVVCFESFNSFGIAKQRIPVGQAVCLYLATLSLTQVLSRDSSPQLVADSTTMRQRSSNIIRVRDIFVKAVLQQQVFNLEEVKSLCMDIAAKLHLYIKLVSDEQQIAPINRSPAIEIQKLCWIGRWMCTTIYFKIYTYNNVVSQAKLV